MMRIPTNTYFQQQINEIDAQYDAIGVLREQLSSGKILLASSDNPVLANLLKINTDFMSDLSTYAQNVINAQNRMSLYDTTSKQLMSDIDNVMQIADLVNNDMLSDEERQSYAAQLTNYLNRFVNTANMTDASGNYIFSGMNTSSPSYALQNGAYQYLGSSQAINIDIGSNVTVNFSYSGFDVFGNNSQGNGTFLVSANPANQGSAYTDGGTVTDPSQYVADTYTLTFVTNGNGQLAYQVVGASSGQVIPPPPATSPTDAPAYSPGMTVNFNGMSMTFSDAGTPLEGDSFEVQPSQKENIFTTLQNLISLLNTDIKTDQDKVNFHQMLSQYADTLSNAQQSFSLFQSNVGIEESYVNQQSALNASLMFQEETTTSQLGDVDAAVTISNLSEDMICLEATQRCYSQIQQLLLSLMGG